MRFSSSGELNLLMWSDEFPDPVMPNFEKATGIKVNQTPFSQNEEQINKLQATGGEGFDICQPTCNRAPQYKDLQVLAPWDTNKLKNMSALVPSMIENSKGLWTWDDGLYHLPHCWGSEALSFRTDLYKGDLAKLSYGSLWDDEREGPHPGPRPFVPARHRPVVGPHRQACRPTAWSTATRTKLASRSCGIRSWLSPSSTSPG